MRSDDLCAMADAVALKLAYSRVFLYFATFE